jgi:3-carboxy-cis,cis-muconate cycloisomerase
LPFDALFVPQALRDSVSDDGWLRALLDAERALARACARAGAIPTEAADAIVAACEPGRFDVAQLADEGRAAGNVVEPLVRRLRHEVGGDAARYVHYGATSQDILDTASVLVAREARGLVLAELDGVADACAQLADTHRATVMAGRTLLQQATPTTFGLKAAGWLSGIVRARRRLADVRLEAELGGAAGTLAAHTRRGLAVLRAYAEELDLPEPALPWHAIRFVIADLGAALDLAAGAVAKVALDVELLAQTEVGEVRESTDGSSSTMPHKRNPIGSTLARACAAGAHASAGVLTGGVHEHERAAGAWHAEWRALSDALALTGGAAAWMRETLSGLEVDVERMRANVRAETLSEAERLGIEAREPEDYLGSSDELIDRALAAYRDR